MIRALWGDWMFLSKARIRLSTLLWQFDVVTTCMIFKRLGIKGNTQKLALCITGGLRRAGPDHRRLLLRSTDFSPKAINF